MRGAPRKINYKRCKKMWLDGVLAKDIAKEFSISCGYVTMLRRNLSLAPRIVGRYKGKKLSSLEHEKKVIEYLEGLPEKYVRISELKKYVSGLAIQRLVRKKRIFRVRFCLQQGGGNYRRGVYAQMFKPEFDGKGFYCLDRTAVIRLLMEGCVLPKTKGLRTIFGCFLGKHLNAAEKCAVLWHLGKRAWSKSGMKQSIQIDGILFASKKKEYNAYIRSIAEDNT